MDPNYPWHPPSGSRGSSAGSEAIVPGALLRDPAISGRVRSPSPHTAWNKCHVALPASSDASHTIVPASFIAPRHGERKKIQTILRANESAVAREPNSYLPGSPGTQQQSPSPPWDPPEERVGQRRRVF